MYNSEINEFAAQSNLTQTASYFDIIDASVRTGDTNKRYTLSTHACSAPSAPIQNGGWTSVVISPTGDNMVDLYNSYITATMNLNVRVDKTISSKFASQNGSKNPGIWIGFKDAMDTISQYQILANGQSIYTQNNAIEESYITGIASTEAVKKVDIFSKTRHKDVWKGKDTWKLGAFIPLKENTFDYPTDYGDGIVPITIDFKMDIRRFLPLSAIRMLPAFVGTMEIRLKFSTDGLVCSPVSLDYLMNDNIVNLSQCDKNPDITNKFVPINEPFTFIKDIPYANSKFTITTDTISVSVTNMVINACSSHLCCFGLDDNLYQGLIQRYMNESLSFPIQTLTFQGMNSTVTETGMDLVLTSTPRFVDSIFLLLQKNQNYKTCYDNPLFGSFSLKMGGYGIIPDIGHDSFGPEFYEMVSNAFNTNNDVTGFNIDTMKSLTNNKDIPIGTKSNDTSNFVLAFPSSTDFTYQQGQTSSTPITYQLKAQFSSETATDSPYKGLTSVLAQMGFLKDSVLAIQLRPMGPPIIAIDDFDITSPA